MNPALRPAGLVDNKRHYNTHAVILRSEKAYSVPRKRRLFSALRVKDSALARTYRAKVSFLAPSVLARRAGLNNVWSELEISLARYRLRLR